MVGYKELVLRLYDVHSLKDKRAIRQSIIRKVQNQYHVSIAEIADQDVHNLLVIGIAVVGNETAHIDSTLQKVEEMILTHYDVDRIQENTEWI